MATRRTKKQVAKDKTNLVKLKLAFDNLLKNGMSKWKDNIKGLFQLCLTLLNHEELQNEFVKLVVNKFINPLPVKGGIRLVYFLDLMVDLKYPDIRNANVVAQDDIYSIPLADKICDVIPSIVEKLTVQFAEEDGLKPYWAEWKDYVNKWNHRLNRSDERFMEDDSEEEDPGFMLNASVSSGALPPKYDLSVTLNVIDEDADEPPVLPLSSPLKQKTVRFQQRKKKNTRMTRSSENSLQSKLSQYPLHVPIKKPKNRRLNPLEKTKLNRVVKQFEEAEAHFLDYLETSRTRLTHQDYEELDNIAATCHLGLIEKLTPQGICDSLISSMVLRRMKKSKDEAIIRLIYTWIQCHIDFELNQPRWASQVSKVINGGRANATGIAKTFEALCKAAGIEKCHTIKGKWKAITESGEYYDTVDHTWNVVFVNNTYTHIDCSVGLLDRANFLPDPHHFYLSHKPQDDKWVLFASSQTYNEWAAMPWSSSFGTNLYDVDPSIKFENTSERETFSIPMTMRPGVIPGESFEVFVHLKDKEATLETSLKLNCCYTFEKKKKSEHVYTLVLQFPEAGSYIVDILQKQIQKRVEPSLPIVEEEEDKAPVIEEPKKGKKGKKAPSSKKKEVEEPVAEEEKGPVSTDVLCSRFVVHSSFTLKEPFKGYANIICKEYTQCITDAFIEPSECIVRLPLDDALESSPIVERLEEPSDDEGGKKKETKKGKKDKVPEEPYSVLTLVSEDALPILYIALHQEGIFKMTIRPGLIYYCVVKDLVPTAGFPSLKDATFVETSILSISPLQQSIPAKTDVTLSFILRNAMPSFKARIPSGKTHIDFTLDPENNSRYVASGQFDKKAGASIEYAVDGTSFVPLFSYLVQ